MFQLAQRIRAVSGGTGASKTISILFWLIDYAQSVKKEIITIVAESVPHLQLGAIRDFKSIMQTHNYWKQELWNESTHIYKFETGTLIEFISFDKFGKAHGPRRDVLFLNEANNIPYNIADQLITRTRKVIWMDWNPSEEFWFYTEMKPNRSDIDHITLNYLDNEALDEPSRQEIESHKNNKQWWQVYGLGQLGEITSRIYTGWNIVDDIPKEARLERYGLDFGYSNDPSCVISVFYFNGGWIFEECLYRKGMSNKDIADVFQTLPQALVVADSAEPKSIDELRSYGLNVMPANKGKDSVNQGIQLIIGQPISITRKSANTLKEYRNYLWMTDKNGKMLNEPNNFQNHAMDAIRYAMSTLSRVEPPKSYFDRVWEKELGEVGKDRPLPNLGR